MKRKGFTLIELLVVIAIIALLMGLLMPALNKARQLAVQLVCGTNLKGMGGAMMVYANAHEEAYPRAGGPGSIWTEAGVIASYWGFPDGTIEKAFGIEENPPIVGHATVTSSLFLLVKFSKITLKNFVCKGDDGAQPFDVRLLPPTFRDLDRLWDFGEGGFSGNGIRIPFPGEVNSYGYQLPYAAAQDAPMTWAIIEESNPSTPVLADRNPYLDKNNPGNGRSGCHLGKGQNVLFKDGSVDFDPAVTVGLGGDNIYTYRLNAAADPAAGTEPTDDGDGFPWNDTDAYLVSEMNWGF